MRKNRLFLVAVASALASALIPLTAAGSGSGGTFVSGSVKGGTGMNIALLAPDGQMTVRKLAGSNRFRLRLRGRGATLQLIGARGTYYGPVVLRAGKGRAYQTLSGKSVNLGRLRLRGGYASASRVPSRAIDLKRIAKASRAGKPIGAGKLGVTRTKGARTLGLLGLTGGSTSSAEPSGAGSDPDGDGIPNAVDADDNGNLVLDNVDPLKTGPSSAGLFSTLNLRFENTVNANAGGASIAQIDAALSGADSFNMIFFFDAGYFRGHTVSGAHVDCFQLKYCRKGNGTAIISGLSESSPSLPRNTPWAAFSPDGSSYPNLDRMTSHDGREVWAMGMQPRVGTADIHPGDTYNVVFNSANGPIAKPTVLSSFFETVPAVSSYSVGGGTVPVSYPVQSDTPGRNNNPVVLPSGSISLNFWRPQRAGIAGVDAGPFADMGHLHYGVSPTVQGTQNQRMIACKGYYSAYVGLIDGPATSDTMNDASFPLLDASDDAAPSVGRQLGFTLDVAGCLRAGGIDPAGQRVELNLTASGESRPGGSDRAAQSFTVQLP